jgi:hypothetical protein
MYSRQVEQLARQANAERTARSSAASQRSASRSQASQRSATQRSAGRSQASQHRAAGQARPAASPASTSLRRNTGWAIVSIGLRIAESGNR